MNENLLRALRYVHNTNGGATLANFTSDHSPIGVQLWTDLLAEGLVREAASGRIFITEKAAPFVITNAKLHWSHAVGEPKCNCEFPRIWTPYPYECHSCMKLLPS
jgi:hypothetical protein